ncbi:YadA-like family protein [Proteus mirabilis]|uniref:YadA-like family protein n=1 Tax=Proteus mirabilis TaxID=584 RepID=UPI002349EFFD|nr:YadA-like family protein [Proteus mirabilis]MDC5895739.1 YadA-like family protein [Proteus mirabilis]MDC5916874.1 YadA-like family protein [Proteus mirabilis]MDC5927390.1 YadA-like family protein [Proteus mirabilis]MDC6012382.1 YadA-like family protein [Proteus mirabilis]MDC6022952.1 YadA-like family protein [Proteus mirabilis]
MNYNKLFLISLSLIYSANVFSNTDSPLPTDNPSQLGNGSMVESSVDIPPTSTTHLPQPPLMRDRAPTIGNTSGYMSRFTYTFMNPIARYEIPYIGQKSINNIHKDNYITTKAYFDMSDSSMGYYNYIIGKYIESYLNISNPSTPSENIVVSLAQPFFDHMRQSLSEAIHVDPNEVGSMLHDIDKNKKDIARALFSYLENVKNDLERTMNNGDTSEPELAKIALLDKIKKFKNIVDENIKNGTSFIIVANQETAEPLTEIEKTIGRLSQPATQGEVANAYISLSRVIEDEAIMIANQQQRTTEKLTSQDNKITKVESDVKKNEGNIAVNREGITKVESDVEKNKEDIQTNREDIQTNRENINQVKQTAGTNKIYVDKYLINDFDVNEQSKSLVGHLGSLYAGNKSNTDNINAIKNDLSHFKNETNNRFYKVEKRANQGIASVAAMSNLPFNDAATFSTAMGIGNYRNATAFAWGMQYRINENVKVKASTAWNDANNWVSAGGIGISW